jgi:hypothetical protein
MLIAINRFIVDCSQSWWKVLLLFAGQTATMQVLMAIEGRFPSITEGDVPFDMQNSLRPEQVFEQLAGYTEQAFSDYYLFQLVDFAFPLLAGLFLASVCAFALRHAIPGWYKVAVAKNLFVLLLLATLFDYLENLNFLWVIASWPEKAELAAQLGVLAKQGKLASMMTGFTLTGLFLVIALLRWVGRKSGLINSSH